MDVAGKKSHQKNMKEEWITGEWMQSWAVTFETKI